MCVCLSDDPFSVLTRTNMHKTHTHADTEQMLVCKYIRAEGTKCPVIMKIVVIM